MISIVYNPNILNTMRLDQKVFKQFIKSNKTLAIAESCTGGHLGDLLTNIPGASAFFLLGIIAYDNEAKIKILNVPSVLIKENGAVSKQVAIAMAQGVRKILKTDYGLGITGIAGPGGGSITKPVGLVYIALSTKKDTLVAEHLFKGNRLSIKKQAAQRALKMLAKQAQ